MFDQIYEYFNKFLPTQQCGFRQGSKTQRCLLKMTKNWRKYLDKDGVNGALLTDISMTFDCLLNDVLIGKLAIYGFDYELLTVISQAMQVTIRLASVALA